jgi:zinc protease
VSPPSVLDRSQPPAGGAPRRFAFPPFRRLQLANGLQILAARRPRFPLVDLEILSPAGGQYEALELPGLASLHGELLDEGTGRRSALEIAARIEALGGFLSSGAGWNMAFVETGVLARHLAPGLELLADIIRSPSFEEGEIDRLRHQRQVEILRRQGQPTLLGDQAFNAAVYRGTVYGRPLIGTAQGLERAGRERLRRFYRRHVVPGGSTLIAVGDLDVDELHALAEEHLGGWTGGPPPRRPVIVPPALAGIEVHLVDRPGSAQTQLQIGQAGVPRPHPDFHALMMWNAVFGGKFTSRINLILRERHGFTYSAQSYFTRRQGPGPFVVRSAVATGFAGDAAREVVGELRRMCEEPITEEELAETRDYLVGVFPYTLQTVGDLTKRLENLVLFDLGDDHYEHYPALFHRITREEILRVAREHLRPENLAIVAVGPAEELRPQFEDLGPVSVHSPAELSPPAG